MLNASFPLSIFKSKTCVTILFFSFSLFDGIANIVFLFEICLDTWCFVQCFLSYLLTFCSVFVLYLLFKSEQLITAIKLQKRICNYTENYCCGGLNFLKHLILILSTELNKLTSHNKRLTRIDEGILFNKPSFQPLTVVSLIKHNFMFEIGRPTPI